MKNTLFSSLKILTFLFLFNSTSFANDVTYVSSFTPLGSAKTNIIDNTYILRGQSYVIPMLYFGDFGKQNINLIDPLTIYQSPPSKWFVDVKMGDGTNFFMKDKITQDYTTAKSRFKNNPFKMKDAEIAYLEHLRDEKNLIEKSNGFIFRTKYKLGNYDLDKQAFNLQINSMFSKTQCLEANEFNIFLEKDTNLRDTSSGNAPSIIKRNALCIEFPNLTSNKFNFDKLPTPPDVAKNIIEGFSPMKIQVWVECEFANLTELVQHKKYNDYDINGQGRQVVSFATCPITKVHLLARKGIPSEIIRLALYQAEVTSTFDGTNKKSVEQIKLDKVKQFDQKDTITSEKKNKQIIDITK